MIDFVCEVKQSELVHIDMDISAFSRVRLDDSWKTDKAATPYNRLYAILDGHGYIRVNGKETELHPGNMYFIPAGSDFAYGCGGFLEKDYLHINFTQTDGRDLCAALKECIVFEHCEEKIRDIDALLNCAEPARSLRLYALLTEMIASFAGRFSKPAPYSALTADALEYIRIHYREHPSESELAKAVFVSNDTLRKTFRREVGVPIIRYENDLCLRQAERELRTTSLSVKEISRRVGFSDALYFSRVFAAKYGLSPQKYRSRNNT